MNSLVERVFRALTSWKRAAPVDEHEHIYTNEQHNQQSSDPVSLAGGIIWSSTNHHLHNNHHNHHHNPNNNLNNNPNRSRSDELIDLTQYPNNNNNNSNQNSTSTDSNHYYYAMSANNNSDQQITGLTNSDQNQTSTTTNNNASTNGGANPSGSSNILRFSFINPSSSSSERRTRHHSNNSHHHRNRWSSQRQSTTQRQQTQTNRNEDASAASSSASSSISDETSDLFSSSTAANTSIVGGKRRERNLLAACCSIFCIAVLCVSLVETRWFYLNGGGCNVNYIGVAHFFAPSPLDYQLEYSKVTKGEILVYTFVLPNGLELKNCANREIMVIMRTVIAFVFLAIFSSSLALMLDTCGCMRPGIKLVRRHAIFHILTCIFCLAINGFCFWVSERMNEQQNETRPKRGKRVDVAFDVSYYLIVLASGLSILATAFTLIRRYPTDEDEQLERLLEEYTGFEEPLLHLERSLPAVTVNQPNQPQIHSCQVIRPHSSQSRRTHSQSSDQLQLPTHRPPSPPPPPPPPPPLLNSSRVYQPVVTTTSTSTSEPPPPYDPSPTFA